MTVTSKYAHGSLFSFPRARGLYRCARESRIVGLVSTGVENIFLNDAKNSSTALWR